ncbi:ribonuclease HII [Candidatus Halobeggiatoa sp. HSG11]|nr:ribonuclease HII [Candidatus Halobeggiatoa sp. HSG11]
MKSLLIAGVDEVGRGCLAGPVVAAAVILDVNKPIDGLADSKTLTEKRREILSQQIHQQALAVAFGRAENDEIDAINILQASLLAMQRAVNNLSIEPDKALVDGKYCPKLACDVEAIIKGDQTVAAISAASIVAKVARDQEMRIMDDTYPNYGFKSHKGYPTKVHLQALQTFGITSIHRKTFAPVRKILLKTSL